MPTLVPWIIQDAFPGYHGVAWYWKEFDAPAEVPDDDRFLLRFWQVDYKADVWLNDSFIGSHEGGESPFVFDVTDAIKPGQKNRVAVRVLNPTPRPIDGIVLTETAHRNKVVPYAVGNAWDQGGICDSVELLVTPVVRVEDLFVRADWKTGNLRVQINLRNAGKKSVRGGIEFAVAPAATGKTLLITNFSREIRAGDTLIETTLRIAQPHLWNLDDPFLYRVTARVSSGSKSSDPANLNADEQSARCGFRDFRFEDGAFRLNGRRIFLRCSHTGNGCPIGLEMPHDPDFLRRDFINQKMMRFNSIRFISGVAKRYQLDLADEIGLMVYEESYAAWCLTNSPHMTERYDESVLGMVRRDRNHPSVTMWGLLNETSDGPVFRHAVNFLPDLRELDDSRLVFLNSGRFDNPGDEIDVWRNPGSNDPSVTHNGTDHIIHSMAITWDAGELAFEPGDSGQDSAVRWTAPKDASVEYSARFKSAARAATTDLHVLHNDEPLFDSVINLYGKGPGAEFRRQIAVKAGDTLDSVCGWGNHSNWRDMTGVAVHVKSTSGETWDAAADFSNQKNPNDAWSFGMLEPADKPDSRTFAPFPMATRGSDIGSISNPGSTAWENVLSDVHPYQNVPHTGDIIRALRTLGGNGKPVWLSEYGVGSANDLMRIVKWYEQAGKPDAEDALLYRGWRDKFLADWERYRLGNVFGRPGDFFAQSNARMAGERLRGINALRSNPNVIGYSLTGTVDQGMTGEGIWTTFRELKPGATDAIFDGFAPLRWCLFAEPANIYRGGTVKLEAVLANEDALAPGEYPVRIQVIGPNLTRAFDEHVTVKIADPKSKPEPALAQPVFEKALAIDGPPGDWRFLATFEKGAAASGEETKFFVDVAPQQMPKVDNEIVLLSSDAGLADWLTAQGIHHKPYSTASVSGREVILASGMPEADPSVLFPDLARRIARGSTVVFLTPETCARGDQTTGWLPLKNKGALTRIARWLYHSDEWAERHPIFDDLPSGGLLDYSYYGELIPEEVFAGLDSGVDPVVGGINAALGYQSGLMVAVCKLGAGQFILNTLLIRENLGKVPEADRLLRNMLRFAAHDADLPSAELPANFDEYLRAIGY